MDKEKVREKTLQDLEKEFGKGIVMRMGEKRALNIEAVPSGSLGLDKALGVGGFPKGRVVEIYGAEACLDKDTFISYEIRTEDGKRQNSKGGTIKHLYERFHDINIPGQGYYQRPQTAGSAFYASCVNEEGRIFKNKIVDVVKTGVKDCFKVSTSDGQTIVATKDHKFFTGHSYKPLEALSVGSTVMVHNSTRFTTEVSYTPINRKEYFVKYHPVAGIKKVEGHAYHRLLRSRAVVEAALNNMSLEEYITELNNYNSSLDYLSRDSHVHHIDENCLNDSLDNLAVISVGEHERLHAIERHNNLRFMAVEAKITEITAVGERETYDIKMLSPFNNYVAEGFVVHNSGKSTTTLHAIAEVQKRGGHAALIDAEHATDPVYAANIGVDLDNLVISQPDYGEQALEIAERFVRSNAFDIVVVDSVAALVPKAEIEAPMEKSSMGLQARMMSQALRKLTAITSKSKTILFFVNQTREKIGVMYGSPTTTSGGNALKFYASVRLEIKRMSQSDEQKNNHTHTAKIKVVKNKVSPPFQETSFEVIHGVGIDKVGEILTHAGKLGLIEKGGAWYTWEGQKYHGLPALREALSASPDTIESLEIDIRKAYNIPDTVSTLKEQ